MTGSPEEEETGVILDHGAGVTGEVAQAAEVDPEARGHLEHAAPRLVHSILISARYRRPASPASYCQGRSCIDRAPPGAAPAPWRTRWSQPARRRSPRSGVSTPRVAGSRRRPRAARPGRARRAAARAACRLGPAGWALRPGRTTRARGGEARSGAGPPAASGSPERPAHSAAPPAGEAQPWALSSARRSLHRQVHPARPGP